jgi:hypothetical protein
MVSFQHRVTIPQSVMFRQLEGESVILDTDSEIYYGLDEVGTRMWILLTGSGSISQAYQGLLEEYEVEPEKLRQEMTDLIEQLREKGLLEIEGS